LSLRFCFSSRSTRDKSAPSSLFSVKFSSTRSLVILAAHNRQKTKSSFLCNVRNTPSNRLVYSTLEFPCNF
jgi:hypothetical protein